MENFSSRLGWWVALLIAGFISVLGAEGPGVDRVPAENGDIQIHPLNHATFTLDWNGKKIFVDPVGGAQRFQGTPDLILVTDIHGDHLNADTLKAVAHEKT